MEIVLSNWVSVETTQGEWLFQSDGGFPLDFSNLQAKVQGSILNLRFHPSYWGVRLDSPIDADDDVEWKWMVFPTRDEAERALAESKEV